jgi:uncharacterized protein (DUF3084 family)
VREYRQRKKEIGQLEKDLANRQQALDGHQEEIEKAKKDWLEPLQNLIEKNWISNSYTDINKQLKKNL